jgi:hypothetical protein
VSSPLLSHPPTGGSSGATQRGVRLDLGGVSQSTLGRQGWTLVCFIFIFYFVRLPLCNKYSDVIVTFISIHSVIMCSLLWRIYEMHPALSLKSGCDTVVHRRVRSWATAAVARAWLGTVAHESGWGMKNLTLALQVFFYRHPDLVWLDRMAPSYLCFL